MSKKTKANLEFLLVKAELKENSWRFTSAPHASVSPVLHAKILAAFIAISLESDFILLARDFERVRPCRRFYGIIRACRPEVGRREDGYDDDLQMGKRRAPGDAGVLGFLLDKPDRAVDDRA